VRPAAHHLAAAALPLSALLCAGRAAAVEVPNVGGQPMLIDVTNTSIVDYHFNNRDDSTLSIPTQVNDNYGEWLDRLNLQISWWRLRLGARVDSAVFYHRLDRDAVAALVSDQRHLLGDDPGAINQYTTGFWQELHSRYLRAVYPSKLFVGYAQPGVDVTVGDFYVQLGRGLVFSVRKIDELAVDTTVRGAKVVADHDFGAVRIGATLFGGQLNPLRVDETSGRRLHGEGSPLFFGFPKAGDFESYDPHTNPVTTVTNPAVPSYLEDTAVGGKLDLGTKWFSVGANAVGLLRRSHTLDNYQCHRDGKDEVDMGATSIRGRCASLYPDFDTSDPSKSHSRIVNFSGSINVPSILQHGDLYLEVAGQQMRGGHVQHDPATYQPTAPRPDLNGYAVYLNASANAGPVSISFEGKHYRNFFPLSANIDTQPSAFSAPEFALVTYSQPPTAEPIYTETVRGGSPGVCVTGGRARVDYRFNRETSVYGWVGRYSSWSETPYDLGNGCAIGPTKLNPTDTKLVSLRTDTWDAAVGGDLGFEKGKSHLKAWVGTRHTDYADVSASTTGSPAFYHEGYVRYDIIKHIHGPFSLQLQGFHRRRYEPLVSTDNAWTEGENYTALQWSPHLSVIMGYEYLVKEGCQPARPGTISLPARAQKDVCHFVNGGLQWRTAGAGSERVGTKVVGQLFDSVSLFVGQRRAALRCVSGVCRQFPPFEGARIEITSRF
jgi:hypothetical protein